MKKQDGWSRLGIGLVFRDCGKEVMRLRFRNGCYIMKKGPHGLESELSAKNPADACDEALEIMFGPKIK